MAIALVTMGLIIYLVGKKGVGKKKKRGQEEKEKDFLSRQRKRFSDAYGEYTL